MTHSKIDIFEREKALQASCLLTISSSLSSKWKVLDLELKRNIKNSHKITPLLWMISKVTLRVKLSLNLLINAFRGRFPIMGLKISPEFPDLTFKRGFLKIQSGKLTDRTDHGIWAVYWFRSIHWFENISRTQPLNSVARAYSKLEI